MAMKTSNINISNTLITQLRHASFNRESARLASGMLGHALIDFRFSAEQLREMLASLSRQLGDSDLFIGGYITALSDLLSATERSARAYEERAAILNVAQCPLTRRVLQALVEQPQGATELARNLPWSKARISSELNKLKELRLVTEMIVSDTKIQLCELTPLGHVLTARLEKSE